MNAPDWNAIRKEFPTLERWTYLDVARKTVAAALPGAGAAGVHARRVRERRRRRVGRAEHGERALEARGAPRREALPRSRSPRTRPTGSTSPRTASSSQPGDNIVLTDMEHLANVWVWKHWEAKGVEIRYAANRDGRLPLEAFLEKMDARTRVVSTAYVTYGNGYRVEPAGARPHLPRARREARRRRRAGRGHTRDAAVGARRRHRRDRRPQGADGTHRQRHRLLPRRPRRSRCETPFVRQPVAAGSATSQALREQPVRLRARRAPLRRRQSELPRRARAPARRGVPAVDRPRAHRGARARAHRPTCLRAA